MTNGAVVCCLAGVCCALWGSAFPCVKLGYALFSVAASDTASILLFAGMRFALAGVLALVIGSALTRKPLLPKTGRTAGHIIKLSLLQTIVQYVLFYIGLAHTTGVKASIIEAANVFVAILVAALLFHQEKLTARKIIGCVVGFAGVVAINMTQGGLGGGLHLTGEGFLLLSTVSYAFSAVLLKRYGTEDDPVLLSGWQFLFGGAVMSALGLALGGRVHPMGIGAAAMLLYLACISAVAYSLWGILLKYNPISRVSVYGFMNPVFGVLLSALLLREGGSAFGAVGIAALVLVCCGIYIVNSGKAEPAAKRGKESDM